MVHDIFRTDGRRDRFGIATLLLGAFVAMAGWMVASPAEASNRTLSLYFTHTKESIKIVYKRNGAYVPSALRELNRFLRDWRRNEATKMDPELFDLIWEVQQEFGGKTIHVVSAYRSPATNSMLRKRSRGVAKNSQHMAGKAIDFYIKGAKISRVREEGIKRQVGGVGYYPRSRSPFVHMDTGRVRAWPRMSRSQLVKLFPNGKTLHIPSNGKPLSGYKEAQALEKAGKLQKLKGGTGVGVRSLFAFGGARSSRTAATSAPKSRVTPVKADPKDVAPSAPVAAPSSRVVAGRVPKSEAKPAKEPAKPKTPARREQDTPRAVQTASLGPATQTSRDDGEGRGLFRQLPSVSLGGLIDRFSGEDEVKPEVATVAPPAAPLTSVAVDNPEPAPTPSTAPGSAEATAAAREILSQPATPAPVPRVAPRRSPRTDDGAPSPLDEDAPVVVAALPPQRSDEVANDALREAALGYARPDRIDDGLNSPQTATAALLPRPALSEASADRRNLAPGVFEPTATASTPPMIRTAFAPVRGASPALIANTGTLDGNGWDLNAPDRVAASSQGVLMAQGFLGAPSGFSDGTNWPTTTRFTGLKITVFARRRSGS